MQWIVRRNYEIGGSFATRFIDNWHDTGWETSHNLGREGSCLGCRDYIMEQEAFRDKAWNFKLDVFLQVQTILLGKEC